MNGRMTEELERSWKKAVIDQLTYNLSIHLEEQRKTMKNVSVLLLSWLRFEPSTS
jgi:hypothetical protein